MGSGRVEITNPARNAARQCPGIECDAPRWRNHLSPGRRRRSTSRSWGLMVVIHGVDVERPDCRDPQGCGQRRPPSSGTAMRDPAHAKNQHDSRSGVASDRHASSGSDRHARASAGTVQMKPGWFETPKKSAVECCERSDKCRQHAEESSAPLGKVHWLRLSEEWLQLAEEADGKREERASASIRSCGDPDSDQARRPAAGQR